MVGKWQLYTRINSRRSRDALNRSVPLGKRFEIKPNLESISDGAPRAADHPRRFGPFHHFPSPSPRGGHRAVRSRGGGGSAAERGFEGSLCWHPPALSHRTSAATLPHLAAAPPRGSICRHIWAGAAPPRGHICRRRGAAPRRGREERGSAQPRRRSGRAEPARRGGERRPDGAAGRQPGPAPAAAAPGAGTRLDLPGGAAGRRQVGVAIARLLLCVSSPSSTFFFFFVPFGGFWLVCVFLFFFNTPTPPPCREVCSENKIATTRYPCLKPTGELTTCFRWALRPRRTGGRGGAGHTRVHGWGLAARGEGSGGYTRVGVRRRDGSCGSCLLPPCSVLAHPGIATSPRTAEQVTWSHPSRVPHLPWRVLRLSQGRVSVTRCKRHLRDIAGEGVLFLLLCRSHRQFLIRWERLPLTWVSGTTLELQLHQLQDNQWDRLDLCHAKDILS